jgi:hypothetical protein
MFFSQDYAGYIVGYDHKKELGSYLVPYDDGGHRHFKKGQLDEYRNYYEIMRNCSQPLVPEQPHDAEDQARDPNQALFADLVTVPGTYADTVLNAGSLLSWRNCHKITDFLCCAITICQLFCLHATCIARFAMPLN